MPRMTQAEYAAFLARTQAWRDREPGTTMEAVQRESDLHADILAECRRRGWYVCHGSMAHATHRTIGEPDFIIGADNGVTYFIEAKARAGKPTPAQQAAAAWLRKLGHRYALVRSMAEFMEALHG